MAMAAVAQALHKQRRWVAPLAPAAAGERQRSAWPRQLAPGCGQHPDARPRQTVPRRRRHRDALPRQTVPRRQAAPRRVRGTGMALRLQGSCGSCWSLSTSRAMDGAHYLATGKLEVLSEQQMVDCDHKF
ncbi:hypothetical protein C2845_PM07G09550 [Panicum miliaceum]|uniref:Peptidase C1A papain C-terminal domain-containing protein n=1 Tax=Panicum miliaceum TaxID=4540 RepID=A0A3L6SS02_PANMI|nr:hypothetical protein C2845_PM07G09550 [Panicum miliaceum]